MDDQSIENEIQAKGLTAPRVTASGTTGARSDSPRRLAPTPDRGETADDQEAIRAPSRPVRGDRG